MSRLSHSPRFYHPNNYSGSRYEINYCRSVCIYASTTDVWLRYARTEPSVAICRQYFSKCKGPCRTCNAVEW
jgi:hypothetical protein